MKISFHSYGNKTDFHMKSFARSLAFIMRFKAARKWPVAAQELLLEPIIVEDFFHRKKNSYVQGVFLGVKMCIPCIL